jgi:hypothetical protein
VSAAQKIIPVGVVVERRKAQSEWIDYTWRPASVLPGIPEAKPWTVLSETPDSTLYYAGSSEVELHISDTTQYRDNLNTESPSLWVVLRETGVEPPYEVFTVTADSAEGEGLAYAGTDIVEPVPMPDQIADVVMQFVTEHHVERVFFKRKRTGVDPESLGRRPGGGRASTK